MTRIRNLFSTPKKTITAIACLIGIVGVLSAGTVYAASAIAESSSIGAENARNFAFVDAGVDPVDAAAVQTEFKFEQGQFVYDIEFIAGNTEYEYWIKASNGSVVKKEMEIVTVGGDGAVLTASVTLDEAKETALADAGLTEAEVEFTRTELDTDHGMPVYEIEFCAGNVEYEYEINAETGMIYSKSKESHTVQASNGMDSSSVLQGNAAQGTNRGAAQGAAQSGADQQTASPGQPVVGSGADAGSSAAAGSNPTGGDGPAAANGAAAGEQITLDKAKANALADAGLSESGVTFTKTESDYEDGVPVYEIEFYTSTHEYEYEISAQSGAVYSKSIEAFQSGAGSGSHHSSGIVAGSNSGSISDSGYIGVDQAKSIAVGHAGCAVSDVTFSKAKLDHDYDHDSGHDHGHDSDHSYVVYEIKFYKDGTEYEYEINAITGSIIKFGCDDD